MNKFLKITMAFIAIFGAMTFTSPVHANSTSVCAADAMMCPDGTFVGRSGPNCQFVCEASPNDNPQSAAEKQKVALIKELKAKIADLKARIEKILLKIENDRKNPFSSFQYSMSVGSTDSMTNGEVTKLQKLLISEDVYPEALVTGYYGSLTAKAVKKLKEKYGITEYPGVEWSPKIYNAFEAKKKGGSIGKACTKEYKPVCGEVQPNSIRCIKAPCPSNQILKTYGNKCMQESAGVTFLHKGKCAFEGSPKTEDEVAYDGKLKYFSNENDLKKFLTKNEKKNNSVGGGAFPFMEESNVEIMREDTVSAQAPSVPGLSQAKSTSESAGDANFSATNTQVDGVDEADIVKTDGRYIYALSQGKKVSIVDTKKPKDLKVISSITSDKNENISQMYLYGDKLVLMSNVWNNSKFDKPMPVEPNGGSGGDELQSKKIACFGCGNRGRNFTRVEVYNISNPKLPRKEKTIEFEGNMNNSRVTNGHLYLLTNKYFYNGGPIMPMVKMDGVDVSERFWSGIYYFDERFYNRNIVSINAINLKNTNDISSQRILMPYAGQIFVSQKNIYLTHATYTNQNEIMVKIQNNVFRDLLPITRKDHDLIERITNTDDDIMSDWEKANKISQIYRRYEMDMTKKEREVIGKKVADKVYDEYKKLRKEFQKTQIQKFSLNGTKVTPKASGEVSGMIRNQFSMNEKSYKGKDFFYIATTNNPVWLPWQLRGIVENNRLFETENNLYSLDTNMKPAGKVEGIARGERIQSVRFVGDHAYMVTFKQVDPLFNIDISNPYRLKILGELKIPGFSQYLHPVYEDRLIGFGRDVTVDKNGRVRNAGLKVTLFDISGDNPKEIESLYFGKEGSYSEALNNHKAVLISDKKGIMAFPATLYSEKGYDYQSRRNVVELLKISRNDISEIAQIHNDKNWQAQSQRALYIGDVLYSIAPAKILSNDLKDGDALGKVLLEEYGNNDDEIYPIILE